MAEGKALKGIYACTNCDNIEASEREVICWKCGVGHMQWHRAEAVAYALHRDPDAKPQNGA